MGSIRLAVGTEWLLDGRAYRVVRQPSSREFTAVDLKFNTEALFTEQRILELYTQGRLKFGGTATSLESSERPSGQTIHDLSETELAAVQQRWEVIEPLTRLSRLPTREDFRQRAAELVEQGTTCSARSLRRYWTAWHEAREDRLALVPAVSQRGGRGRSRRQSLLVQFPALNRLVTESIQEVYLTTARRPVAAVTRRVLDALARHNSRLPAEQAVPIPRVATLDRAICRRIAQLDPWEVDRARWGKRIADRKHQSTQRQNLARRILERVEIDHTPLKVVVGDEAGPIGQPWLTVLIDYYSRMIVGFCVGFEPPSYGVVMEALRHAILPKAYLATTYPRVRGDWPCFGIPERLVCDRGSDFASQDLEQATFQLGIQLDFNPPRTPHFKGTVESFFDVLNDELASSLPGRTFRSWEKRADYNPDDGPLMPYETLREVIHIHLVDVYSASKHPTAGKTRGEMWDESAVENPPCLPAAPDDLIVLLARRAERTLSARGLELGGMFYSSAELLALRAELAANNLPVNKLTVRYNPWDLGSVWVLNPLNKSYIQAPAVDEALQGMTEYQWRTLKRTIRERFDDPNHLLSLAAGRNAIRDVVERTARKPSRKRRVRSTRFLDQPQRTERTEPLLSKHWVTVDGIETDSPTTHSTEAVPTDPKVAPPVADVPDLDDVDVDDWDVA
ncbi:MAG: transposase family protein [Planctomycetaceae bacterium]|nr:transposase family protein [Planctomycetaceae bacterium]